MKRFLARNLLKAPKQRTCTIYTPFPLQGRLRVVSKRYYTQNSELFLGIETSCDDTCAAVIKGNQVLSNVIRKQIPIHEPWGGIVPKLAADAHGENIDSVVQEALEDAGVGFHDLTAIAVTRGPGLAACLNVGLKKGVELSLTHQLPLVPVNHMEGHALISRMMNDVKFPFLTLLISGGHTQILVCQGVGEYILLGDTVDIAIGDVFDKVARTLKISSGVFGGQALELAAQEGNPLQYSFTLPMRRNKNCDFSFSGIQTAVNLLIENRGGDYFLEEEYNVYDMAASFQRVCVDHLHDRLERAMRWCERNVPEIESFVVSGGVAGNLYIQQRLSRLAHRYNLDLIHPPKELCTDNAVMIAWAGIENYRLNLNIETNPEGLRYIPKWPLDSSGVDYFPYTRSNHMISTEKSRRRTIMIEFDEKIRRDDEDISVSAVCKAIKMALSQNQFERARRYCDFGIQKFPDQVRFVNLRNKVDEKERSYRNKYG